LHRVHGLILPDRRLGADEAAVERGGQASRQAK
jgi:hypothetical protein